MKNKMTSKQALEELYVDIKQFEEHFIGRICFDSEEEYNLIKKDLEVLEILKGMLTVEKGSTWYYLDTKHPFFEKQEDIDKVKEWLEND